MPFWWMEWAPQSKNAFLKVFLVVIVTTALSNKFCVAVRSVEAQVKSHYFPVLHESNDCSSTPMRIRSTHRVQTREAPLHGQLAIDVTFISAQADIYSSIFLVNHHLSLIRVMGGAGGYPSSHRTAVTDVVLRNKWELVPVFRPPKLSLSGTVLGHMGLSADFLCRGLLSTTAGCRFWRVVRP